MKRIVFLCLYVFWTCIILIGCSTSKNPNSSDVGFLPDVYDEKNNTENNIENNTDTDIKNEDDGLATVEKEAKLKDTDEAEEYKLIMSEGNTLATRINPPDNYERIQASEHSFTTFMRSFTLKGDGSSIHLYNGEEKSNQSDHVAIFDIAVGDKDLQQCADSIMRIYSEYYWSIGEYDKIAFHLTNNFLMEYVKWRDGYRLSVSGNDTSWIESAEYDDTYENFLSYLERVFMYAGTLSLDSEGIDINLDEITPGDIFIEGGSPGHCVLVIDIAENSDGEKAFLLAQGYMPAQEFHVLKNPLHEENPWYYTSEITYPFETPQWTFDESSLERWFK